MHLLYQIQEFIATDHRIAILKPPNRNIKIDTLNLSVSRSSVRIFQTLLTKTGIGDLNTIQTKSRPIHILSSNWGRQLLQSRTRPDCGVECFHVDEGIILGAGSDGGVIETERLTLEAAKEILRNDAVVGIVFTVYALTGSIGLRPRPEVSGSILNIPTTVKDESLRRFSAADEQGHAIIRRRL